MSCLCISQLLLVEKVCLQCFQDAVNCDRAHLPWVIWYGKRRSPALLEAWFFPLVFGEPSQAAGDTRELSRSDVGFPLPQLLNPTVQLPDLFSIHATIYNTIIGQLSIAKQAD